MRKLKLYAALAVVVLVGLLIAWWALDLRWRPKSIDKHQAEIARILETSGWVSPPGMGEKKLYMISFRSCTDCLRFEKEAFPKLHKEKVDTRVIVMARRDDNGIERSTPIERATVAQLWITRSWPLFEAWHSMAHEAWQAPDIPPADGDMARTAVVEAGRKMVDDLTPLLKDNGIDFYYPLLIWWTKDGEMHGCACEKPQAYRRVLRELGV